MINFFFKDKKSNKDMSKLDLIIKFREYKVG